MTGVEIKRVLRETGVNSGERKVQEGGMATEKIIEKMKENMEELSMLIQEEKGMWRFTQGEGRRMKG